MVAWTEEGERLPAGTHDLLNGFTATHPGLRVNLVFEPWSQAQAKLKYWCGTLRDYAPDITIIRDTWLPTYAACLLPLDTQISAPELGALAPSVVARCRAGGKLVGLPWRVTSRALYYRTDLLTQAGLQAPRNLAELAEAARKLSHPPGVIGLGLPGLPGGDGADVFLGLLAAGGGRLVDEKGELQLASAEGARALQYWVDLSRAGATQPEALSWGNDDVLEAFGAGRVAMVLAGSDFAQAVKREHPKLQVGVCAVPGDKAAANLLSCDVAVAMAHGPHPQEAAEFLRFLAGPEAQKALWMMGSLPASHRNLAEARLDPKLAPFLDHLEVAGGWPMDRGEAILHAVDHALWLGLSGRSEPAAALPAAAATVAPRPPAEP
jgi:N,N'-diacetylchitobiose transport system substrate-binding protein